MLTAPLWAHGATPGRPDELMSPWLADLGLLVLLAVVTLVYRRGGARSSTPPRPGLFGLGLGAVGLALLSPLEKAAAALASAHMVQHVLLTLAAAPLLAAAGTAPMLAMGFPRRWRRLWWRGLRRLRLSPRRLRLLQSPPLALAAFTLSFWTWHASGPYQAAVESELLHAVEHLTLLAAALVFWQSVLTHRFPAPLRLLALFGAAMQGTLLAALLTFSSRPWYGVYADTAPGWGLDAVTDQHLAGLVMWVPGGLVYCGVAVSLLVGRLVEEAEREAVAR